MHISVGCLLIQYNERLCLLSAKWPTRRIMQHHQEMAQCWVWRQGQHVLWYLFSFRFNRYARVTALCPRGAADLLAQVTCYMSDIVQVTGFVIRKLYCECFIGQGAISWFGYCHFSVCFSSKGESILHSPPLISYIKQNYGHDQKAERRPISSSWAEMGGSGAVSSLDRICNQAEPPLILLLCPRT